MHRHPQLPARDPSCGRLCLVVLVAVCAVGLFLRIWMARLNIFPTVDGVMYMDQASQLLNHGRLPFSCFPPGWPLLISVPLLFMDKGEPMSLLRAAQTANVVLGAALPLLTFLLARRYLTSWLSLSAAAIMALLPQNIILAKGDLSETSYACCLLGSWLLLQKDRRWAAGFLFGFTYLIRPEAVLAVVGLGLYLGRRERKVPWPLVAGSLALIIPYLVYIKVASGHWGLSSKDVAVTLSLQAHPGLSYLGLVASNSAALAPHLTGLLGLPLVLLAVWGAAAAPGPWLWMVAPLLPVPFIINPMVVRFWQPYLPYFLLAAGLGVGSLAHSLQSKFPPLAGRTGRAGGERSGFGRSGLGRPATAALLSVALAGLGLAVRDDLPFVRRNTEAFYGLKDAGAWLRPRVAPDTVIADYKPYTSFWAGCRFIKYPDEQNTDLLVAWARNNGARYLVVNALVAATLAPGLVPLLEQPLSPRLADKLTLVQLFEYDLDQHDTFVYSLNEALPVGQGAGGPPARRD